MNREGKTRIRKGRFLEPAKDANVQSDNPGLKGAEGDEKIRTRKLYFTKKTKTKTKQNLKQEGLLAKHVKASNESYLLGQNTTCEFSKSLPSSGHENNVAPPKADK